MKIFRTLSAISLALLVLLSSTSFMVGLHICAGNVQDVKLFTKADVCAMEKQLPPCHKQMHRTSSCCDDEAIVHTGEDFNASVSDITLSPFFFTYSAPAILVIAEIIPSVEITPKAYYPYDPPLRSHDRTVDLQVFNI
jgi:hypothetical protein